MVLACSLHFAAVRASEEVAAGDPVEVFSESASGDIVGPSLAAPFKQNLNAPAFRLPESTFKDAERMSGGGEMAALNGPGFELFPDRQDQNLSGWTLSSDTLTTLAPRPPLSGLRNWDRPFMTKAKRSFFTITGIAVASGVVLAFLPQNFSRWDGDVLSRAMANLKRAWTRPPVWDEDIFFHNYLGHPYAGAFYYNMVRSQGATAWQSFGYALFQSTFWEYVVEALAEQPSIQDLFITPVIGSLLGELFNRWSLHILRSGRLNLGEKALVFFLNPAYVVNNGYRRPE
ncbi:MAG TPA: DUF3943 domain-containing protein [Thermoanaerobaculia bacterium]|nr:DUF3943 domain-containing protein [Thermoanaerobaculia bacterium]